MVSRTPVDGRLKIVGKIHGYLYNAGLFEFYAEGFHGPEASAAVTYRLGDSLRYRKIGATQIDVEGDKGWAGSDDAGAGPGIEDGRAGIGSAER
jgi:hypothetical protein